MIYVFDTCSLSILKNYYQDVFQSVWQCLGTLIASGSAISTREVAREMANGQPVTWLDSLLQGRDFFKTPDGHETAFVQAIFQVPRFADLIGTKQRLRGTPVADPFVIACAKIRSGTVVTEERYKLGGVKIPNVCAHFSVPSMNLEEFMRVQGWRF